jgi:large subunit ribosomal protein L4
MSKGEIKIYNLEGKEVGNVEHIFNDVTVSDDLISQVLRVYETNLHQGTRKAKTRGEVSRPDKKPWRQKGTGRARHGSRNSPIWIGGGVAHGPVPHTRRLTLPKQVKVTAMKYFVDTEVRANNAVIVEDSKSTVKTKDTETFLKSTGLIHKKVIVVLPNKEENMSNAFRNLKNVKIRRAELLSPWDLYGNKTYVFSDAAYKILVNRLKNDSK